MERALSLEEFGNELLRTQDLDPVYVALHGVNISNAQLRRLCLTYWCVYHLGVAAKLSTLTGRSYWTALMEVAVNKSAPGEPKPWPRGAERRHFRGAQAVAAVVDLAARYKTPEHAVAAMLEPGDGARPTFGGVSARVQEHQGFGPWIAFKIADMSERVLGYDTDFTNCELGIYKDPRQGAALARFGDWKHPITDPELKETVDLWVAHWRKKRAKAPPKNDRLVNVQEIETIFCKYKSHVKGHYPPLKDTTELRHGLVGWGPLAHQLLEALPHGKA